MDKNKKDKQIKEKKKGPDGLTKKERRALKVEAKQSESVAPTDQKIIANAGDVKVVIEEKKSEEETQNKNELSEKELRRLEWQKKLEKEKCNKENELSKAELKAKRREAQDAQRQAKVVVTKPKEIIKKTEPIHVKVPSKSTIPKVHELRKVQLVQHLYHKDQVANLSDSQNVHPDFVRLGIQYNRRTILGSNARAIALLSALKTLVRDLRTPPSQEFCRYLESVVQTSVAYLQKCRPLAVSMTNALRVVKVYITNIDKNLSDQDKKSDLLDFIENYVKDEIITAGEAISITVNKKIVDGDVLLIYGCSSLITRIIKDAHSEGKQFQVIIVDGRPLLEGRELLRKLSVAGIKCAYILINAVSYIMPTVTKVLLGAHALLTNGYVMSRIGTSQVALVAQAFNKPVLVCCETYKFCEKVQTDSLVYNEIGYPDTLPPVHTIEEFNISKISKPTTRLTPLHLLYDVTPPDLVTAVVTELAILPCTSVPVVLRINVK